MQQNPQIEPIIVEPNDLAPIDAWNTIFDNFIENPLNLYSLFAANRSFKVLVEYYFKEYLTSIKRKHISSSPNIRWYDSAPIIFFNKPQTRVYIEDTVLFFLKDDSFGKFKQEGYHGELDWSEEFSAVWKPPKNKSPTGFINRFIGFFIDRNDLDNKYLFFVREYPIKFKESKQQQEVAIFNLNTGKLVTAFVKEIQLDDSFKKDPRPNLVQIMKNGKTSFFVTPPPIRPSENFLSLFYPSEQRHTILTEVKQQEDSERFVKEFFLEEPPFTRPCSFFYCFQLPDVHKVLHIKGSFVFLSFLEKGKKTYGMWNLENKNFTCKIKRPVERPSEGHILLLTSLGKTHEVLAFPSRTSSPSGTTPLMCYDLQTGSIREMLSLVNISKFNDLITKSLKEGEDAPTFAPDILDEGKKLSIKRNQNGGVVWTEKAMAFIQSGSSHQITYKTIDGITECTKVFEEPEKVHEILLLTDEVLVLHTKKLKEGEDIDDHIVFLSIVDNMLEGVGRIHVSTCDKIFYCEETNQFSYFKDNTLFTVEFPELDQRGTLNISPM